MRIQAGGKCMDFRLWERRQLITLLSGAAAAWPLAAGAQQAERMRRVAILMPYAESDAEFRTRIAAFRQELGKLGWTEGANLRIEERWTGDDLDRVRRDAAELINLNPEVIVVAGRRVVPIVAQQTRTIPVVFVGISDPVTSGLVESFARPGGNLTGFSQIEFSLIGKLVEGLKEVAPSITRMPSSRIRTTRPRASICNHSRLPRSRSRCGLSDFLFTRRSRSSARSKRRPKSPGGGILFPPDLTILAHRKQVVTLAAKYRLPAVYTNRAFVAEGGLMSHGVEVLALYRRAAS